MSDSVTREEYELILRDGSWIAFATAKRLIHSYFAQEQTIANLQDQIAGLQRALNSTTDYKDVYEKKLANLQRDKERLDWLSIRTIRSSLGPTDKLLGVGEYLKWSLETRTRNLTVREAIDAAMSGKDHATE